MQESTANRKKIIHIDMDCFFAAIEMRDDPKLRNVPIAVGGEADRRGVISTSNYEARKFGVRSAMATAHALKLCPKLIIVTPNFNKYKEASEGIREIFYHYTELVEPLSLDEAFLDVTSCPFQKGSATLIAKEIRQKIFESQGLTASAGIASNKFLAKIASDWNKPNGQFTILPEQVTEFIKDLPVEKIFGVGKVTAKKMHAQGIKTCQDLQQLSLETLHNNYGKWGERLFNLCRGIDDRDVETNRVRKSVSVEHTFEHDIPDLAKCLEQLPILFEQLTQRLKKYQDRIIHKQVVKIKFFDFKLTTMETVVSELSLKTFQILFCEAHAREKKAVRLIGVGVAFKDNYESNQQLILDF